MSKIYVVRYHDGYDMWYQEDAYTNKQGCIDNLINNDFIEDIDSKEEDSYFHHDEVYGRTDYAIIEQWDLNN